VDTSEQVIVDETPKQIVRRRRSVEEKRRIVEETLETGASVARVARRHAVNANQVFFLERRTISNHENRFERPNSHARPGGISLDCITMSAPSLSPEAPLSWCNLGPPKKPQPLL